MSEILLEIDDVKTHFPVGRQSSGSSSGVVRAVDGVSLKIARGEIVGLVGESGCGKSTLGRTILQLIRPTSGRILFAGRDLAGLGRRELRTARRHFQMIFQDPFATLNTRMTVYDTLAEAIQAHRRVPDAELSHEICHLLTQVGLPTRALQKYPHEFSGGQRQRIAIARALAVKPELIIADEPVSALDVSIQAQIINLLSELCRQMNLSLIFISHDLSVVKHISDRIAVMYLGKIVELGPAQQIFENPHHPYTKALVSAVPIPDPDRENRRQRMLLPGDPPSPLNPPAGCTFHPRCPFVIEACKKQVPPLAEHFPGRLAACIRVPELESSRPSLSSS